MVPFPLAPYLLQASTLHQRCADSERRKGGGATGKEVGGGGVDVGPGTWRWMEAAAEELETLFLDLGGHTLAVLPGGSPEVWF